jgi:amidase
MQATESILYASASTLAKAIRTGALTSEEVVAAHIERIRTVNPTLNAVVQLSPETALTQARHADAALARGECSGPLHGVPITVKDNLATAGIVSTAGIPAFGTYVPSRDATVVARLRAAGAIVMGKTNMPELGLAHETDNILYGRTNNPYDVARTVGGSTGGEASIIAAGGSPLGVGNDMACSLRLPAHFCGVATLKPTAGRVPSTGTFPPIDRGLAAFTGRVLATGPIARWVEDLCLALPLLAGADGCDPSTVPLALGNMQQVELKHLRVAFYTENGVSSPTVETVTLVRAVANLLADSGMAVTEARPPGIAHLEQTAGLFFGLLGGGSTLNQACHRLNPTQRHPLIQHLLEGPLTTYTAPTVAAYCRLWTQWDRLRGMMLAFMEPYDALLCPVTVFPAPPHGFTFETESWLQHFSYTCLENLTGWPSVVVRAGSSPDGLPLGIQIVAHPWREEVALAVAQHIETACGGYQPPPCLEP